MRVNEPCDPVIKTVMLSLVATAMLGTGRYYLGYQPNQTSTIGVLISSRTHSGYTQSLSYRRIFTTESRFSVSTIMGTAAPLPATFACL